MNPEYIFLLPQYHCNENFHINSFCASITSAVCRTNINKCNIPGEEWYSLGGITPQLQSVHRTSCQREDKPQTSHDHSLTKQGAPFAISRNKQCHKHCLICLFAQSGSLYTPAQLARSCIAPSWDFQSYFFKYHRLLTSSYFSSVADVWAAKIRMQMFCPSSSTNADFWNFKACFDKNR